MFMLLVLLFIVVALSVVVTVLVKGNESLKTQHRAYVDASNSVYDNHADIIIGLQAQVEDLLSKRANDQELLTAKDNHIDGLVEEIKKAAEKVAVFEKLSTEAAVELEAVAANEAVLKLQLDNVMSNYKKLEAYSVSSAKKSNDKNFDDCLFEDDYVMEIEKELGIHWFK